MPFFTKLNAFRHSNRKTGKHQKTKVLIPIIGTRLHGDKVSLSPWLRQVADRTRSHQKSRMKDFRRRFQPHREIVAKDKGQRLRKEGHLRLRHTIPRKFRRFSPSRKWYPIQTETLMVLTVFLPKVAPRSPLYHLFIESTPEWLESHSSSLSQVEARPVERCRNSPFPQDSVKSTARFFGDQVHGTNGEGQGRTGRLTLATASSRRKVPCVT